MLQGKLPQPHPLKASAIERTASHQDCTRPPAKWATSEMGPLCHANKTTNQGWVLVLHVRWYYWLKTFLGEWLCDKHVKVNIVSRARSKSLKPWSWSGGQLIKWAISNRTITVPVYPKWCICKVQQSACAHQRFLHIIGPGLRSIYRFYQILQEPLDIWSFPLDVPQHLSVKWKIASCSFSTQPGRCTDQLNFRRPATFRSW